MLDFVGTKSDKQFFEFVLVKQVFEFEYIYGGLISVFNLVVVLSWIWMVDGIMVSSILYPKKTDFCCKMFFSLNKKFGIYIHCWTLLKNIIKEKKNLMSEF